MLSGKLHLNKRDAFESFNTEWVKSQYKNNLGLIFFSLSLRTSIITTYGRNLYVSLDFLSLPSTNNNLGFPEKIHEKIYKQIIEKGNQIVTAVIKIVNFFPNTVY